MFYEANILVQDTERQACNPQVAANNWMKEAEGREKERLGDNDYKIKKKSGEEKFCIFFV
jgi:hypothetical protein